MKRKPDVPKIFVKTFVIHSRSKDYIERFSKTIRSHCFLFSLPKFTIAVLVLCCVKRPAFETINFAKRIIFSFYFFLFLVFST